MATNNSTILDQIRLAGTDDYQQRVPSATQSGIQATQETLFDPQNRSLWNQFVDGLINRIGQLIVNDKRWSNPLAEFKRGKLNYGDTVEEIASKLIKARGYDIEADTLFKINRPDTVSCFHNINRRDRYDITINEIELRKAFTEEYGLNSYIQSILAIPFTSDNYDEFQIMKQLLNEYQAVGSGFANVQVDAPTDYDTAKELLRVIQELSEEVGFLKSEYNRAGVPTHSTLDQLMIVTTPKVKSYLNVEALAVLFNEERADVQARIVTIDEFGDDSTQAYLLDKSFFVCFDTVYENTSFYNPQQLSTNYYLHHQGVYSVSPFVTAIRLSTDPSTSPDVITMAATGIATPIVTTLDGATVTNVSKGNDYLIVTDLEGTVTPANEYVGVLPDSVTYEISNSLNKNIRALQINYNEGDTPVLHIPNSKLLVAGTDITVTVVTTYIDPTDGTKATFTDAVTVTIV